MIPLDKSNKNQQFLFIFLFVYFLFEKESMREGRAEGERILSRCHVPCRARLGARFHDPGIMTSAETKSQTLNGLSHPDAPLAASF